MVNYDFDFQLEDFMLYCRTSQLRPKTMASYEQTLRLFQRWLKEELQIEKVNEVTEPIIRKYLDSLMERGKYTFYSDDEGTSKNFPSRRRDFRQPISPVSINNYIRNIRVFFNWLERDYKIQRNPMKKIRQLKVNRKAKEYITDEDFRKLISFFDKSYFSEHRDYAMIFLMLDTGMRLGECTELLEGDISLHSRKIHLRAEITKGRKDRTVYFSEKTEIIVRRWLQYKDRYCDSVYIFPVKKGSRNITVSCFESNFKTYLQRAGLKENISPHCLRNNYAKRCLMNGMDIYTLSRLLGHSSVQVTEQAYLDLTDEDLGKKYVNYSPISSMK
jgi:integrase/recombinase XerD